MQKWVSSETDEEEGVLGSKAAGSGTVAWKTPLTQSGEKVRLWPSRWRGPETAGREEN